MNKWESKRNKILKSNFKMRPLSDRIYHACKNKGIIGNVWLSVGEFAERGFAPRPNQ